MSSQSRYPSVYVVDVHENGTEVPCTWASDAAWRAAENLGLRVGPNDRATLAYEDVGLQDDDELVDGQTYRLVIIGGTV